MSLDSQNPATSTSSMFTMLLCSWSAAAFRANLKLGDTRKFSVSLFTSSNFMVPRRCLCICVMLAGCLWKSNAPSSNVRVGEFASSPTTELMIILALEKPPGKASHRAWPVLS